MVTRTDLITDALTAARDSRGSLAGAIFHSDHGQYTSKAFAGVCLLVGWVFLLRATVRSLGALGTVLACAFFGTLIWLIVSWAHLEPHTSRGLTYLILVGIAAVLATGSAWSIVRRRLTGQVDVEEQKS